MTISVAMCTYNGERFLREELESIAGQSRLPDELVICDDASTDATRAIIAEFAAAAPFPVRLYENERTLGASKNFERAIGLCECGLIALCDQDDVWLPHKLAQLEAEFVRRPGIGLIFTDAELVDEHTRAVGGTLWRRLPVRRNERRRLKGRRAVDVLLGGSIVTGATMAFRARFKDLVLPVPEDLTIGLDAWIPLLVAAVSDVHALRSPLIKYRQHPAQQLGARERRRDGSGLRGGLRRTSDVRPTIEIARRVQQRLAEHGDRYRTNSARARLAARGAHLETRMALPERALSRFKPVAAELLTGRYRSFSRGLLSAAKDLVRGPQKDQP